MKHTRAFTLLVLTCAAVLVIGPQAFAAGAQLLTNPGFEDLGGSYNGWFTFGNGVQISTAADDNIFRSGVAASKTFGEFNGCPIPNFDVGGYGQLFTPIAGQVYEFSGYGFVAAADSILGDDTCTGNRAIAKVVFFDAVSGGAELSSNEIIIGDWSTPLETWVPFTVSAPAPAGALRVEALILFLQPGCETGAVYVDDLHFSENAPVVEPNILVNPSFDTNLIGWTTFGNVFHDDRYFTRLTPPGSAKLFGTFVDGSDSGMFQKFGSVPDKAWKFSVYAMNTCAEDGIRGTNANIALARIVFRDTGGADIGGADVIIGDNSTPLGTWVRYEVTATAPAGTDSVFAYILFTQGPFLEGGAIFVDDAAFDEDIASGIDDTPSARGVDLHQNVPNPFNPTTQISFDLAESEHVKISVYDVSGRLVNTLFEGELGVGPHSVAWDGTAVDGARVASGVYFYVLRTASGVTAHRSMVMLK